MELNKILSISYYAGMVLLFAGIVMHLSLHPLALWVYAAGLLPIVGIRIYNRLVGKPENRRKHTILVVSGLALVAAGVAMYLSKSFWVAFIAVSAVLDFYISFRRF